MISANHRQNQEFLLNSGFCISFTISTFKSRLCWPAGVSIFFKCFGLQDNQSSIRLIVQNTIFNINKLTIIQQVPTITNSSRFV